MIVQKLYRHTATRHGRMIVFANDTRPLTSSLLRYGEWAEREINFMSSLIGQGATVLDVGAHIGTYTLAFSRLVGPNGRVVAFERQPTVFRVLQKNVSFNRLPNVILHGVAVGFSGGEPALDAADPKTTSEASVQASGSANNPVVNIDEFDLKRCDLLKVNVDGMERLVIEGARGTIQRHQPWIYADCNSAEAGLETRRMLQALGYGVRLHLAESFNAENVRGEIENVFADARQAALLGVPPGRASVLSSRTMRECEMLLEIDTADDLVLGMLNKPQYVSQLFLSGSAAASGPDRWIRDAVKSRWATSARVGRIQEELEAMQALAAERAAEIDDLSAQLKCTEEALDAREFLALGRLHDLEALEAKVEATLRQAEIARSLHRQDALRLEEASAEVRRIGLALLDAEADHARERDQSAALVEAAGAEANRLASALADALIDRDRERSQVAALLGSTSWRLTKPVRALGCALRGRL